MLKRGARVALSARGEDSLREIAAGHEDRALVLPMAATSEEAWMAGVEQLDAAWGFTWSIRASCARH